MNTQEFSEFDDDRIQQFEKDWISGNPGDLGSYLPAGSDPRYLGTLEELVHIDLEFRWKNCKRSDPGDRPPPVERYLDQFPELQPLQIGLIKSEFELSYSQNDQPSVQAYVDRFASRVDPQELRPALQDLSDDIQRFSDVKPGATLDHYEITAEQGRGGFGAVWRANDTKLGRRIAVKQLGRRLAKDNESRRRFISEARVTAQLEHPGIVPVYDISNQDDEHAYYTMRLIQGQTLAEAIESLHRLDPKSSGFELLRQRLIQSFIDTCQTIEYAHSQGVVHRDLKPQNIIVGDYGETILLDWGLASVLEPVDDPTATISLKDDPLILDSSESVQTLRGRVVGTPAYMSPEQARGEFESINRRSDVYSLGATLYHLITGNVPFTNGSLDELLDRVKSGDLPPAHDANPDVEKALSAIAAKAMRLQPAARYDSVSQLLDDVQKFRADQPVSAYRDPLVARAARWIRKNPTAAATATLIVLFGLLAATAGIWVTSAWKAREEKRISNLQIAAERAEATALSQIRSGRFDSATNTLGQAIALVSDEPRLSTLSVRLAERQQRTGKIVEFYRFSRQAQEETFFDRISRSAKYSQAALDQLGVLTNHDWWAELPDQDLTPLQRDQLRIEAYRIIGLLSCMRLVETANTAFSFDLLTEPKQIAADDPVARLFRASGFAASQGIRFRDSRAMRIVKDIGDFASGNRTEVDLTGMVPQNSIDAAIMGSILDNNVPARGPARTAVSALVGFQDPNDVAHQWLDAALRDNPDWFWLPVFMGVNLLKTGEPDDAIKILSHAVGVRPNYWVGYQFRAWASTIAARKQRLTRKQKTALLNSASRDIQRAMDLEKNSSSLFWIKAAILIQQDAPHSQIIQSFIRALSLHPTANDLQEGHYSAISATFYNMIQEFVADHGESNEDLPARMYLVHSAGLLWQGKHDEALRVSTQGLEKFPDNDELQRLRRLIHAIQSPNDQSRVISLEPDSPFAWNIAMANAAILRNLGQAQQQRTQLQNALQVGQAVWQKSSTLLQLAEALVESGREAEAIDYVQNAIALDPAVDLLQLLDSAKEHSAEQIIAICSRQQAFIQPKVGMQDDKLIDQPALLNAGFELGLSYHWSAYTQRTAAASWNNFGLSNTVAETETDEANSGQRSLSIEIDCPANPDCFGIMTQTVPVSKKQTYEISCWAKAVGLGQGAVRVGVINSDHPDPANYVTLDSGSYPWKKFSTTVTTDAGHLPVSIWAQGSGHVYIDDIRVRRIQP